MTKTKRRLFEIKVFAGYRQGGETYYNCFKEYVTARNETAAGKAARAELRKRGYIGIELSEIIPCD